MQSQKHTICSTKTEMVIKVYCYTLFYLYNRSIEAIIHQARQDHLPEYSEESTTCLQVRRKHIWKDTLRGFKQPRFTIRKWLKVEFVGESAIDDGGGQKRVLSLWNA